MLCFVCQRRPSVIVRVACAVRSISEAMLGSNFGILDMNIYYSDDEMRKQAGSLVGKCVVTGQETVQGSGRALREDLFKKHISADKVQRFVTIEWHRSRTRSNTSNVSEVGAPSRTQRSVSGVRGAGVGLLAFIVLFVVRAVDEALSFRACS